jgi:hypothetical protein
MDSVMRSSIVTKNTEEGGASSSGPSMVSSGYMIFLMVFFDVVLICGP